MRYSGGNDGSKHESTDGDGDTDSGDDSGNKQSTHDGDLEWPSMGRPSMGRPIMGRPSMERPSMDRLSMERQHHGDNRAVVVRDAISMGIIGV